MNAERVPFEVPKECSRVCFGGFRPTKHVEGPWALARGAPHVQSVDTPRKYPVMTTVVIYLSRRPFFVKSVKMAAL